ncbi:MULTISPECIES: hypothetical protein [unclassified Streptomyces]|uniref:hypothetical protein n=1 Tax=unclassified Streptomyces TaxID=2593676 RepID=UPI001F033963|nr:MULTISPECIES: hypothetical protein [unclassified Streptomyces]MCH0566800.1 hypothetical protein [Streptomyces sp. MUM 2J]MCH0572319.1 hypothetical protein [Streptomyces sp. MUM 136J]
MHRTTTTATLLVTVAVSALGGCVTVQRPPVSGPHPPPSGSSAPALPSVPRPDGSAEPQIVQAPAREALELVGPSRRAEPGTDEAPQHRVAGPDAADGQQRARHAPSRPRAAEQHPGNPESHRPPQLGLPDVAESVRGTVREHGDVCALGRRYGGWRADSPEAVACDRAYGR